MTRTRCGGRIGGQDEPDDDSGGTGDGQSPDAASLHRRSVERWLATLEAVPDDCWDDPTPCRGWSVRDLVNHVVGEDLWTVPLLGGATIEDVGDSLDGDLLGADPKAAGRAAAHQAVAARRPSTAPARCTCPTARSRPTSTSGS